MHYVLSIRNDVVYSRSMSKERHRHALWKHTQSSSLSVLRHDSFCHRCIDRKTPEHQGKTLPPIRPQLNADGGSPRLRRGFGMWRTTRTEDTGDTRSVVSSPDRARDRVRYSSSYSGLRMGDFNVGDPACRDRNILVALVRSLTIRPKFGLDHAKVWHRVHLSSFTMSIWISCYEMVDSVE